MRCSASICKPRATSSRQRNCREENEAIKAGKTPEGWEKPAKNAQKDKDAHAVLDQSNTGKDVWADSAYRSAEIEAKLEAKGYKSRVHARAARNRPLSQRQRAANTTRSRVRARVEHVFGHQHTSMGGKIVRSIGRCGRLRRSA